MLNENHFTKDAYEDNGRFQIHPLNDEGLEAYLSKDSYNYHFLKSKYDPALLKQIEEELKEEKQLKNQKLKNNENKINENNPKIEDIKEPKNIPLNNQNVNNIKVKQPLDKKNNNNIGGPINKAKNNKVNNKGNSKKKGNVNIGNKNVNKIGNVGHATKPVISNVKNDRGRIKDFQQPYHA